MKIGWQLGESCSLAGECLIFSTLTVLLYVIKCFSLFFSNNKDKLNLIKQVY